MTTVLILTLGTSPDPIINCIRSLRPERVVFLCSSESRKLVQQVLNKVPLPNFETERDIEELRQPLSAKHSAEVENELDQLDRVYLRALSLFERVRHEDPGCRIIADYTGGTKTMTTGLAMAAIDDGGVELNLTTMRRSVVDTEGSRFNYELASESLGAVLQMKELDSRHAKALKKLSELLPELKDAASHSRASVLSGFSAPVSVSTAAIHARRLRDRELPALLKRHDYEAARQAARRIQAIADPDPQTRQWLRWLEALLVGLDAWDRFDHRRALEVIEGLDDPRLRESLLFPLKRVIASRRILDREADAQRWPQIKGHGLEAVEDLLRNAERRASQERYDDAVGRLYRAMELTEQLLLKTGVCDQIGPGGIDTGNVQVDRLPDEIQAHWRSKGQLNASHSNQGLKIGLVDGFDLLSDMGHPTGQAWQQRRSKFVDALLKRNNSLFAHGFKPVDYSNWQELWDCLGPFLREAIDHHRARQTGGSGSSQPLPQLPSSLAALENGIMS